MQTVSQPKTCEGISLADVVKFFRRNQLRIVGWVVAGLFFSTAYLLLAPKKYEARWQMQMAQLADYDVVTYMATYKNIEEPANLIQRLRVPVAYPVAVWKSCGMSEGGEFGDYLAGIFVIQATKNANSTVDMTFRATSVPQARQCAEAIASMIETQQHDLIEEQLTGMQEELLRYRHALHAEEQQLGAIKESGLANWLAELKSWMSETMAQVSAKSPMALAIGYSLSNWTALTNFVGDGRIDAHNNMAERALRGVAIGRKNYLHVGSDVGGQTAAVMYTLLGTAKLNGINPQRYLRHVLERIADHPINRIDELLPWAVAAKWEEDESAKDMPLAA